MVEDRKEVMKESKKYTSVSTRLPSLEAVSFILHCRRLGTNSSERIRDLIVKDMKNPSRQFLSGKNHFKYNKIGNSFSWFVQLDSGKEVKVIENLSLEFLRDLDFSIKEAIQDRNDWVHHTKENYSIDIPTDILGEKGK